MCSPTLQHTTGEARPFKDMPWHGTARSPFLELKQVARTWTKQVRQFGHHSMPIGNSKAKIHGGC